MKEESEEEEEDSKLYDEKGEEVGDMVEFSVKCRARLATNGVRISTHFHCLSISMWGCSDRYFMYQSLSLNTTKTWPEEESEAVVRVGNWRKLSTTWQPQVDSR
jgi:hypothetical protein